MNKLKKDGGSQNEINKRKLELLRRLVLFLNVQILNIW